MQCTMFAKALENFTLGNSTTKTRKEPTNHHNPRISFNLAQRTTRTHPTVLMLHPSMCPRATDSPPSPPQTHMISPLQYYDVPENDDNDEDDTDTAWFRMNPRDDRQPHGCDLNLLEASGVGEDDKQQQLLIPFEAAPALPLALEEIEESSHHREYDNAYGPSLGFQLPVSRRPSSSSSTIPIPFAGMKRTLSEEQLCAEERMADVRDYVMFHVRASSGLPFVVDRSLRLCA